MHSSIISSIKTRMPQPSYTGPYLPPQNHQRLPPSSQSLSYSLSQPTLTGNHMNNTKYQQSAHQQPFNLAPSPPYEQSDQACLFQPSGSQQSKLFKRQKILPEADPFPPQSRVVDSTSTTRSPINSNTVPLTSEISSLQFSTPSRNEKPHTSNKREILVVYQHKVDNNRKSSIRYLLDDCVADSSQDDRNTLELHPPNRQRPEVCSVQEGFAAPSLWSLFQIDWNNNCSTKKREHTVGMLADGNLRVRKSRGCGFLRVGSSQFRFQLLSENILFLIFSFLDHKDLCRMASVCRMLSRYANDEMIWAQLYSARYGVEGPDGTGWKQRYKERSSSHKISIFDLLSP
eukprot:TRINITY_DN925_c0_g1_i2.p1 TRINITY_DN925_c0_g1~~TRINITY_DN925_c0_g1_i2.p1  ORF type:complete len:368 (+),score=50.83 TRINITY_DN925_c0_g1_i2:75-1106(+)